MPLAEQLPLRFVVKTFRMAEGHDDPGDLPDVVAHGRRVVRTAATVEVELLPGEVLSVLEVWAGAAPDGGERVASVPFAMGAGHWEWVPADTGDEP